MILDTKTSSITNAIITINPLRVSYVQFDKFIQPKISVVTGQTIPPLFNHLSSANISGVNECQRQSAGGLTLLAVKRFTA